MGENCDHCNTTSETRQEIADAMAQPSPKIIIETAVEQENKPKM